jgi:hypothetical protein
VQLDGNATGILKNNRHESSYSFGREQAAGIFEAQPVYFERGRISGSLREILIGVLGRY